MSNQHPEQMGTLPLRSITPRYVEAQHQIYIEQLVAALNRADVWRIALAGQYGTGKSSILQGLAQNQDFKKLDLKPVTVSLVTLDVANGPATENAGDTSSEGQTNRIQREIVKQLLHSAPPWEVPLSRYRRISRPRAWRLWGPMIGAALIAGLAAMSVMHLSIAKNPWAVVGAAAFLSASAVWLYLTRLQGRLRLGEFKAGAGIGSVSVTDKSTWFDQYLDEIIYFFDSSGCRLVVFEDIDRFDDPEIFETLRDLNVLLNNAQQLHQRGRFCRRKVRDVPVRFLYAARDSVFDVTTEVSEPTQSAHGVEETDIVAVRQVGAASSTAASRVKYFDYMISVVPFVTPASARDHFQQLLEDAQVKPDEVPSRDVLIRVSRHISDFRLITAIVNDYLLFNRLVRHESKLMGLVADNLFALMVYKNTHPSDFELILSGDSKLNRLYDAFRYETSQALNALTDTLVSLHDRAGEEVPTLEQRTTLARFVTLWAEKYGSSSVRDGATTKMFDRDAPNDSEFWREAAQHGVIFGGGYAGQTRLSPGDLAAAVGLAGGDQAWSQQEKERVADLIDVLHAARHHLLTASLAQAVTASVIPGEDRAIVKAMGELGLPDLDLKSVVTSLGFDALTVDLLEGGYIDRYFSVYVSRYQSATLSVSARNFMMLIVENPSGTADFNYQFGHPAADVAAVLAEAGDGFAQDERSLNIQIFDYLLETGSNPRHVSLAGGQSQLIREFRETYLREGVHPVKLVRSVTAQWPGVFQALLQLPSDERLVEFVDTALRYAESETDYGSSSEVADYLRTYEQELTTITRCREDDAPRLAHVLGCLRYRSSDLRRLPQCLAEALVTRHAYDVSAVNLMFLTSPALSQGGGYDEQERFALDRLPEGQLDFVEQHLNEYVRILDEDEFRRSVSSDDAVASILNSLAKTACAVLSDEDLDLLIARAGCNPISQSNLDSSLWPSSARACRSIPTTDTLIAFLAINEGGLHSWASLLMDPKVALDPAGLNDHERLEHLSLELLALTDLPALRRIDLVTQLDVTLSAHQVPNKADSLIPGLVQRGVLADSAETMQHVAEVRPEVLPGLVKISDELDNYAAQLKPSTALLRAVGESGHVVALQHLLGQPAISVSLDVSLARQLLEWVETRKLEIPAMALPIVVSAAQAPVEAAKVLAAAEAKYDDSELLCAILKLGGPASKLGSEDVEVPMTYLPLVEVLKARHILTRAKVRGREAVRTKVIRES